MAFITWKQDILVVVCCYAIGLHAHIDKTTPPELHVELFSSSSEVYEDFTKDFFLNCSAHQDANSGMALVTSLILSKKSSQEDSEFNSSRLAHVTTLQPDSVSVTASLDADVTGQLEERVQANILYEWREPGARDVAGVYTCVAHGVDNRGNPLTAQATTTITEGKIDVNIIKNTLRNLQNKQNQLIDDIKSLKSQKTTSTDLQLFTLQTELTLLQDQLSITTNDLHESKREAATFNLHQSLMKSELDKLLVEKNATDQRLEELLSRVNHTAASLFQINSTFRDHNYFLSFPSHNSIHEADSSCGLLGGYVVEISDQEEHKVVHDLLKRGNRELGANYDVYIGMTDEVEEKRWKNLHSGTDATFMKFHSGEPSNGNNEDCVVISYTNFKYYDRPCYFQKYRFMCEVEYNQK